MESAQEREQRISRLEASRASRRAEIGGTVWPTPDDAGTGVVPIEVGAGRGDLNYSSGFIPTYPTALGLINRTVSFARLFQSQPWVGASVMRILTWATRVPLVAYRKTSQANAAKRLEMGDHPIADMIANPWPGGDSAHFMMNLLGPILVHGNSVTELDDGNRSGKLGVTPKDWRYSMPIMPWRGALEGFRFDTDTPKFAHDVSIDKVLHCAWWSPVGPLGTSPLMQLGTTIQIEDAAQRYQIAMMRHGGRPPTAVTMEEGFLGIDSVERKQIMRQVRQDMIDLYGGPENAGRPALLPPGLDMKAVGQTTVEAALIDQRKVAREEVAAVYLLPPPILGIMDKANYSNMQSVKEMTYTDCLGPPMILLEQAINSQLIRDLLQDDSVFVEFDFTAVLRGDPLQQISILRDAIASALLTPNEGRNVLNRPESDTDGMDTFYIPANNLKPIETAGKNPTPPQLQPFTGEKPPVTPAPEPGQDNAPPPAPPGENEGPQGRSLYVPSHVYDERLAGIS